MTARARRPPAQPPPDRSPPRRPARRRPTSRSPSPTRPRPGAGRRAASPTGCSPTGWPPATRSRRCRSRPNQLYTPTSTCARPTWPTCRPYRPDGRAPAADAASALPEGAAGASSSSREDGVAALGLSPTTARAAGVILETLGAALAARPERLPADCSRAARAARDDKLAQMTRALLEPGRPCSTSRTASASSGRSSSAGPSARPDRPSLTRTIIRLGDGRRGVASSRSSSPSRCRSPARPASRSPGLLRRHHRGHASAPAPTCRSPALQDLPPGQVAFQHRHAVDRRGRRRSTGRWPSSAAGSSAAGSTTASRATAARSSRSRSSSASATSSFDLTSYTRHLGRDTTGNLLSQGRPHGSAPGRT